ncbi:MAG: hypothetical protein N2109_06870 [Fimbriimonadales bacterium]|nr:hypothetical protein [Fimbriimonadales bacterium]
MLAGWAWFGLALGMPSQTVDAEGLIRRGQDALRAARTVVGRFLEKGQAGQPQPFALVKPGSFHARWRGYEVFHNGERGVQYVFEPKTKRYMAYPSRRPQVSLVLMGFQGFFGPDPAMDCLQPRARRATFDGRPCVLARVRGLTGPTDVFLDPRTGLPMGWSAARDGRRTVVVYRDLRLNAPVDRRLAAWTPPEGSRPAKLPFPGPDGGRR